MNNTPKPQLVVLSLGWGVQSFTLAAMAALNELPLPDYAIHADTTWEREQTYRFAHQMTPWLAARGVNVVTVTDYAQAKKATTAQSDALPFTERLGAPAEVVSRESGNKDIPAFTAHHTSLGQLRRQCTQRWKIAPQRRFVNEQLRLRNIKRRQGSVEKWLGISQDEWLRAKQSDVLYETHRYPLLEMQMTRADCITWLQRANLPIPPKSSCVFCPYHNRKAWQEIKREAGTDWATALEVDTAIRGKRPPYALFVHTSRKPLTEAVVLPEDIGVKQHSMFERVEDDSAVTCDSGHCFL
jgi:hypothetical protein